MSNPERDSSGRYDYSNYDLVCTCSHTLGDHTAEKPRACGLYGTGLNDCPCKNFRKSRNQEAPDEQ